MRKASALTVILGAALVFCVSALQGKMPATNFVAVGTNADKDTLFAANTLLAILQENRDEKWVLSKGEPQSKTGVRIYFGDLGAKKASIKTSSLKNAQSFRIKSVKNGVAIAGKTPLGSFYGGLEFLQRGCDIWMPLPGVTYSGLRGKDILIKGLDVTMAPAITYRSIYHTGFVYKDRNARRKWYAFNMRNRISDLGGAPMIKELFKHMSSEFKVSTTTGKGCHNFLDYVPPAKYAKTHPEYFSMNRDGVRDHRRNAGGQLCLSNEEVFKIAEAHLLKSIAADRAKSPKNYPRVYDFSQEDNTNYICCCPECKKIIAKYGSSDAGLVLYFVNKLARSAKAKYPDVRIRTFAYVSSEKLPSGIKPEDNVIVQFCDLYSQCNNLLPLTHPVNAKREKLLSDWSKITKHMMLWDYILQGGSMPLDLVTAIPADVKFFKKCNIDWIFMETEFNSEPCSLVHLKNFVLAQFYFNADQNLDKLVDVYCRAAFGKAYQDMKEYFYWLQKTQLAKVTADMHKWHTRDLAHMDIPMLEKARAIVKRAMTKEKDPEKTIQMLQELNAVELALVKLYRPFPARNKERAAIEKNLLNNRLKVLRSHGFIPQRLAKIEKDIKEAAADANLVFTDLPAELKGIPRDDLVFIGHRRVVTGGRNGKYVKDPMSAMPRVLRWSKPNAKSFGKKLRCVIYDWNWKKSQVASVVPAKDEKYHWYKIRTFKMGPKSSMHVLDWHAGIRFNDLYVVSDGAEKDPNIYELWVSIKFEGKAYNPNSTKENAIYFERAVLVRK